MGPGRRGFVEGKNVAIEFRFADQHLERVPAFSGARAKRVQSGPNAH
jgi:hypothetical protein